MKLCPNCGAVLGEIMGGYKCPECDSIFDDDEVDVSKCPRCGGELEDSDGQFYCSECDMTVDNEDTVFSDDMSFDDNYGFEERDYDSMVNNGDKICLNCTFWSVSPYGRAYGMICRRGYPTNGPEDSCSEFIQEYHFASYGDDGQYQFDETSRYISNKLFNWKQ